MIATARLAAVLAVVLIAAVATVGLLASNSLPASQLGQSVRAVTANDLKPGDCASVSVTNVVTGGGTVDGSSGNDLILGSSGVDTIDGSSGDDCIVGGAGADTITGSAGSVCIGSADATFVGCGTRITR
jgi:Ca2+-binding RTX toxin-like protein